MGFQAGIANGVWFFFFCFLRSQVGKKTLMSRSSRIIQQLSIVVRAEVPGVIAYTGQSLEDLRSFGGMTIFKAPSVVAATILAFLVEFSVSLYWSI